MMEQRERDLVDGFSLIPDLRERLSALITQTYSIPDLPEDDQSDVWLIRECQSPVWVEVKVENGLCCFRCHAGSPMVAGLVRTMCHLGQGCAVADILRFQPSWVEILGFDKILSPTRMDGLAAAWRHMVAHVNASDGCSSTTGK
jgi:cysteine desulfuration protein SufE